MAKKQKKAKPVRKLRITRKPGSRKVTMKGTGFLKSGLDKTRQALHSELDAAVRRIMSDPIAVAFATEFDGDEIEYPRGRGVKLDDLLSTMLDPNAPDDVHHDANHLFDRIQSLDSPKFFWVTRDGTAIKPSDMSTEHLRNCVSYVQRRLTRDCGSVAYLGKLEGLARAFYEFLREARKRGIDV